MPELPDIETYVRALRPRVVGQVLEAVRLASPFLLRTVDPPLTRAHGKRALAVRRLGKRIVVAVEDDLFLAIHLMVAGRLHWKGRGAKAPGRAGLAAFDFSAGTLLLTEAGARRRAALHVLAGERAVAALDRGGLEVLDADRAAFAAALCEESHTLKRALTDPGLFSGIGNAYSDEILHRARLSPARRTTQLGSEEVDRLYGAAQSVLRQWTERLTEEAGGGFPEKVTAFRQGMAVHGRYRKPCPDCGAPIQRIVYAENESNYCARCQTEGRLLSDRALARLLRDDWPKTLEELEERKEARGGGAR
jgi:formamidopyrimidine-DNA glycosylase